MLERLYIENVAVIEKTEIEFNKGFNIFTGQTGAGKSIIIDSLSLLLGQRASRDMIRTGAEKAFVSATFSNVGSEVKKILSSCDIPLEDELVIERQLGADGRGVSRINGRPVSLMTLKELSEPLINIHGQHMNQRILDPTTHIEYLDAFAGHTELLAKYENLYRETMSARKELVRLKEEAKNARDRADIIEYRIAELEKANLKLGEEEELSARRTIMVNSEKLSEALQLSAQLLSEGSGSAAENVSAACGELQKVSGISDKLNELYSRLSAILPEIEDIGISVKDALSEIEFESYELDEIENRLSKLSSIRKKYGGSIENAIAELNKCKQDRDLYENSDAEIEKQNQIFNRLASELSVISGQITKSRKEAAVRLCNSVMEKLSFLDMEKCLFKVEISPSEKFTPIGRDNVEFYISANVGEEPKPLAKIASGGELSRIMLAIVNSLTENKMPDTLIFDEVDSGVSGKTAQKIGVLIKKVSKKTQVLCVTHQAQIAAMADHHLFISKSSDGVKTYTVVTVLDEQGKRSEVARILGGADINQVALNMAQDLINQGKNL